MTKTHIKRTICLFITVSIVVTTCVVPPKAEARISFNRFKRVTRRVFRKVKRGTKFVVNLPDKATNWMGPVLGPVASTMLTGNIAKNPKWSKLFRNIRRVNKGIDTVDRIQDKQKYLKDLREAYRSQAGELREKAVDIRNSRKNMLSKLTSGEITYDDYKKHVVALNKVADAYEKTADKFEASANKMKPENIAKIFAQSALNAAWGEVKNAVIFETSKELEKLIDPNIIQRIVSGENIGLDALIDVFATKQIEKQFGKDEKIDLEALQDRVKDRVKEILKENKEDLRKNWREKIEEIIKEEKNKLEEEKNKLPEVDTDEEEKKKNEKTQKKEGEVTDELDEFFEPDPDSADKCSNGYEWDIKIGKCIQSNCNSETIPNAHYSYVKDCLCGSSGSMYENPDDPNKECSYPASHKACPGCVYACVGLKDECPKP